jgi:hypothetical protein
MALLNLQSNIDAGKFPSNGAGPEHIPRQRQSLPSARLRGSRAETQI